jgi:hypothetical protein
MLDIRSTAVLTVLGVRISLGSVVVSLAALFLLPRDSACQLVLLAGLLQTSHLVYLSFRRENLVDGLPETIKRTG